MERVFHGSSRIMRTFWKFVHVATLLLPHRHPNSKRNIWHRYSTRFANKFHRKLQKPKKEGSPLRIIRTFWKLVNVATLLLPHRHPDSERSIVTRHVSPTSFTEDSSSKKKRSPLILSSLRISRRICSRRSSSCCASDASETSVCRPYLLLSSSSAG